jgi:hypothetical protein
MAETKPKRMTKREINETISNINGVLAVARYAVQHNDFEQAIAQLEGANILVLLAKVRVEEYAKGADD